MRDRVDGHAYFGVWWDGVRPVLSGRGGGETGSPLRSTVGKAERCD